MIEGFPGLLEGVKLHAVVAHRHHLARLVGIVLRRPGAAIPTVGIGRQVVPGLPAKQSVHRLPAGLANNVPTGNFERADHGHHGGAALILVADQVCEHPFNVERTDTQNALLGPFMHQGVDCHFLPLQGRLTQPGQAGVGAQPHKQVIAKAGIGQKSFQFDNFHHRASLA